MNTTIARIIIFFMLFGLFFSGCGPAPTPVPTITPTQTISANQTFTPTQTSEPMKITPATPENTPGMTPEVTPQIMGGMDNKADSNQIVSPFSPTDRFIFALPDWNAQTSLDVAQKLHATVVGSCHQDNDWRLQKWLDNAAVLSKVTDIAHKAGLKYTAHFTTDQDNKDGSIPFEEEVAVRDIKGNIINASMPNETLRIWKSIHYPKWRDYMINLAKKAVDGGVDILCVDGWTYNYDVINRGGDFSANSLAGFKEYLKNKYSAKLLSGLGISDINTFDYRGFKNSKNPDPLKTDFEDFQLRSSKIFWQEIISETRKYAESKGKKILFTVNFNVNAWEMVPSLPIADTVDGFMSEYHFELPPYNNTITDFKLFRSMGKPQVLIPNAGTSAEFLQRTDLADLMKIYTAEAYASGEFIYPPYSVLVMGATDWQFYNADLNKLYPYYDFITANKAYYENLKSAANTAVLYSYATLRNKQNNNADTNFHGISNLLLDSHRQFDVLFGGDNLWIADTLTMDQLTQYQVLIMPNVADIPDKQLDLILDYVNRGGKVFAFGETGLRNELGETRNKSKLADLLVEGTHPFGQGQFVYVPFNMGTNFAPNKDAATRDKVTAILNGLNQDDIQTNADSKVSMLEYWNTGLNASVIHLINHDYDVQAKHINQQRNISMDVSLNKLLLNKDLTVYYASPDWKDRKELKYSVADNKISFVVPDLDTYGIIYIGSKN